MGGDRLQFVGAGPDGGESMELVPIEIHFSVRSRSGFVYHSEITPVYIEPGEYDMALHFRGRSKETPLPVGGVTIGPIRS
mgnify:CR=1 FL=1